MTFKEAREALITIMSIVEEDRLGNPLSSRFILGLLEVVLDQLPRFFVLLPAEVEK